METTTENLSKALQDVRRAHRILYAYQRRMLDLVTFIGQKLTKSEPSVKGFKHEIKHFSDPVPEPGNDISPLWKMWAWDYLYSYLFEYHLGVFKYNLREKEAGDEAYEYKFSLIQYSDTGYFDQEKKEEGTRLELEKFKPEEESGSKLLFFLEYKSKDSEWEWKDGSYMEGIVLDKKVGSKKHKEEVRYTSADGKQILYSVPLEQFINKEATLKVLSEFSSYCKRQGIHVFDDLILEPTCTPTSSSSEE